MIKVFHFFVLATLLLPLFGCGEHASDNKSETISSAVPTVTAKELTPEVKFTETNKKAEAGNAQAQVDIGVMYIKGEGTSKNAAKAFEWFQKAAAQGYENAQYNIGVMYDNGDGVPKDVTKAMKWYQKSATQGNADAQDRLGSMYEYGEGVPKDDAKAIAWYQKATAQGHADAQYHLGGMYAAGKGVPKSTNKAIELTQKAAAQGHADAQFLMGVTYTHTDGGAFGIIFDPVRAYAWFNLASAQGNKNAKQSLDNWETVLTPAQRAEGQRLASNWKKGEVIPTSSNGESGPTSPDGKPIKYSTGTAFAVSNSGHALTNHHVIEGCTEVRIAGRKGVARVITSDSVNDLALLQLPGKTDDIAYLNADPGKLRQGDEIIVFGYPLNSLLSSGGNLTPGIISALTGVDNNTNQIQITAPIQPGSSGSPVMDKKGNVVGVVSARLDMKAVRLTGSIPQNVNFAVNGQTVKAFLDANKVPYKTGGELFSREKSNADIAEEARKSTMLVECWK